MSDYFEFEYRAQEALVVVEGPGAIRVARSLLCALPEPGRLEYRSWRQGSQPAACCWFPPARLELRVAPPDLDKLLARLKDLEVAAAPIPFADRVRQLISRLEAWSYSDSDSGTGPAESMAGELRRLAADAPGTGVGGAIAQAQDALDDGLPAEVIAATLERALHELDAAGAQPSGLDPSASG
jgi:hypothetical protein